MPVNWVSIESTMLPNFMVRAACGLVLLSRSVEMLDIML